MPIFRKTRLPQHNSQIRFSIALWRCRGVVEDWEKDLLRPAQNFPPDCWQAHGTIHIARSLASGLVPSGPTMRSAQGRLTLW